MVGISTTRSSTGSIGSSSVSNQTVKADEANYRQALALINEARAGLFPTVEGNWLGDAQFAQRHDPDRRSLGNVDARHLGPGPAGDRGAAGGRAELSAATLANATLTEQSLLALAYVTLERRIRSKTCSKRRLIEYKHSLTITQNQYNAGTAAKSDVITAETQVLNAQAQLIAAGVSRAQSEHAIAVLMGRPPAGLSIPHGSLATRVPSVPVGLPSSLLERRPDVAAAEETMRAGQRR